MIIRMLLPCKVGAASGVGVGLAQAEFPRISTIVNSNDNFFIVSSLSLLPSPDSAFGVCQRSAYQVIQVFLAPGIVHVHGCALAIALL
jgi:hypothetical protein